MKLRKFFEVISLEQEGLKVGAEIHSQCPLLVFPLCSASPHGLLTLRQHIVHSAHCSAREYIYIYNSEGMGGARHEKLGCPRIMIGSVPMTSNAEEMRIGVEEAQRGRGERSLLLLFSFILHHCILIQVFFFVCFSRENEIFPTGTKKAVCG